ncbi:MAG: ribonuclease J [Alphaproteobacteria bacterium]|nr:ribonuclease J [Alphaproteobacteria bacterium]
MLFKKDKKKKNSPVKKTPKAIKKAKKVVETPKIEKKKLIKTSMNLSSSDNKVYFGALGGMGDKIGCNLYLYGTHGDWVIVDMGIGFPTERMAGAEYVIPDSTFLRSIKDRVKAILLTHSHEDHYGAIPYIWQEVGCPIYGTAFALKMLENKLAENDLLGKVPMRKVSKEGAHFKLGAFDVEYFHLTHSIPQSTGIILRTEQGAILHTGDWKFDPTPLMDKPSDMATLKKLAREGVLAIMCDSTNSLVLEHSLSEADVVVELEKVVKGIKSGKIVITCFATNVVRMHSIFKAAQATGRKLVVLGRSMETIVDIAKSEGYLQDFEYLSADEASKYDDNKVLYLCTGTQGEPRSVLTRVSENAYTDLKLHAGDTVIFSSKIIPGNEESILNVQNNLSRQGVNVITTLDNPNIHASGHGSKPELEQLYNLLKPQIVIPVHGEPIHLFRNAKIATECKIKNVEIIDNGDFIAIEDGKKPVIVEKIPTAEIIIDGTRHISATNDVFSARRKINYNGAVFISLIINKSGLVGKPEVSSVGMFETDSTGMIKSAIIAEIKSTIKNLSKKELSRDDTIREITVASTRRVIRDLMDKKPPISVHIVRV